MNSTGCAVLWKTRVGELTLLLSIEFNWLCSPVVNPCRGVTMAGTEKIMDGMEKFLKMALQYVRAFGDRERMEDFLKEHPECQELPRDFAQGLLDLLGCMHQVDSKKETVNICKAIDEMMKESKKKGGEEMARDFVQFLRENSYPEDKGNYILGLGCMWHVCTVAHLAGRNPIFSHLAPL